MAYQPFNSLSRDHVVGEVREEDREQLLVLSTPSLGITKNFR
jgi:hypothetical protein